ncbi:MAG: DNA replication/repair protein RecF, partial [Bradymonadaceae bacterium]
MLLDVLRLQHFRNLSCVELEPHPRFNIFAGDNGQGKTNLLEAIYLLSSVRSFRARTNEALIEFGHDCSILEARVDRGGHERVVRIEIDESGKEVFLNRSPVQRLSDFFGTVNVVKFGPDDMSLLEGSPSDRRDFIDDAVLSARPGFATELDHYGDALDQRNAALKQDDPDETLLEIYGRQLAQYGADVVARRLEFVERFEPVLSRVFDDVFGGGLEASVQYDMKWADGLDVPRRPPERREAIEDLLVEALAETADRERDRGYTLVGPHRDDLQAYLDGRDIAVYGSQG